MVRCPSTSTCLSSILEKLTCYVINRNGKLSCFQKDSVKILQLSVWDQNTTSFPSQRVEGTTARFWLHFQKETTLLRGSYRPWLSRLSPSTVSAGKSVSAGSPELWELVFGKHSPLRILMSRAVWKEHTLNSLQEGWTGARSFASSMIQTDGWRLFCAEQCCQPTGQCEYWFILLQISLSYFMLNLLNPREEFILPFDTETLYVLAQDEVEGYVPFTQLVEWTWSSVVLRESVFNNRFL